MKASGEGHSEIVKFLLDNGAAIDAVNLRTQTALIHAVGRGHLDVVGLLLSKGADVSIRDIFYETAWDLAYRHDYQAIRKLLEKHLPPGYGKSWL